MIEVACCIEFAIVDGIVAISIIRMGFIVENARTNVSDIGDAIAIDVEIAITCAELSSMGGGAIGMFALLDEVAVFDFEDGDFAAIGAEEFLSCAVFSGSWGSVLVDLDGVGMTFFGRPLSISFENSFSLLFAFRFGATEFAINSTGFGGKIV